MFFVLSGVTLAPINQGKLGSEVGFRDALKSHKSVGVRQWSTRKIENA